MIDFAGDLAAIMGDVLAKDAVLRHTTGETVSLRVIPRAGDMAVDLGPNQMISGAAIFTAAAAGVERPQAGSTITVGQVRYEIVADAMRDARGLTWVMEAREIG